jgi:6-phosphogluconolactonase
MIAPAAPHMETLDDPKELAKRVADWLIELAEAKDEAFSICLSGGSTPKILYQFLAGTPYAARFPWNRTHLFWGDERFVPIADERSNYRMASDAMIDHVPIPVENIHAIPTENIDPHAAAMAYEQELKSFYGADTLDPSRPLFDVVLLGLGPDGHTASLFPGTGVLNERTRWASEVVGPKSEMRITLTYPALESTANGAFLIAGTEKQAILRRYQSGDTDLPARRYRPIGALSLFLDTAAAPGRVQRIANS